MLSEDSISKLMVLPVSVFTKIKIVANGVAVEYLSTQEFNSSGSRQHSSILVENQGCGVVNSEPDQEIEGTRMRTARLGSRQKH